MTDVKNNKPYIIGLTGGIASGKTCALQIFNNYKIPTIDCDKIVSEIWEQDYFKQLIRRIFQIDVKVTDDKLKRVISTIVFESSEKRKILNDQIHPLVFDELEKRISQTTEPIVVVDMPLLFELNYNKINTTLLIYIPEQEQIKRLCLRNNINGMQAKKIIDTQMPIEKKFFLADHVIDNTGSRMQLEREIKAFITEIKNEIK